MLGQLTNIPTDTLIDMLYIISPGDFGITANDVTEIEQIQRELQRRRGGQNWSFGTVTAKSEQVFAMSLQPCEDRYLARVRPSPIPEKA